MSRPWWTKWASPTKEQWAYANAYHRAEEYAKKRGALRSPPKKKQPGRRVALMPAPVAGPSAAPFGRMQSAPLPSQKTWMEMMERLESKYGPKKGKTKRRRRRRRKKKVKTVKKKRPSKKAQRAFRAELQGMVKRWKSVSLDTTLRQLVQAFPQAAHALKVWPKRSSLHSTVGRVPGSKRKLNTFL